MTLELEGHPKPDVIALQGELTIDRAGELKQVLVSAIDKGNEVVVDVEGVTALHLSCLQILCSAHHASVALGKRFALVGKQQAFLQAVKEAGYARTVSCQSDSRITCLWMGA